MMAALKAADPVRDRVVPYDEVLLSEILAGPRPAPSKRRRRRVVVATWLSVVLVPVAGLGVAAEAGLVPSAVRQAFPWVGHTWGARLPRVDLSTAVRVISEPGPEGRRFEVWVAKDRAGNVCVTRTFVGPPATAPSDQIRLRPNQGGTCGPDGPGATLGGSCGPVWGPGFYTSFSCAARGAVRAEVRLPDGTTLPVAIGSGWMGGWLPLGVDPTQTVLTSFAANGTVIDRFRVVAP
jgi:hypothetical protein